MASRKETTCKTALVIGFLGVVMMLKPATCQAQAEINPNHYESINTEPFSLARNSAKAQAIQVRLSSPSNADGPGAMVLHRTRQRHTLTAIGPKEAGMMLDLHSEPRKSPSIDTVRVPVSSPARKVSEN